MERSEVMRRIGSRNTRGELLIRKRLHALGFRYRLNSSDLPGKPDMVLAKYRAVIFVHGCFWHGHVCRLFRLPKTNTVFWSRKIAQNRSRDQRVYDELFALGWRVAVVWECSFRSKGEAIVSRLITDLAEWLHSDYVFLNLTEVL